jgi:hypothetical protein
MPVKDRFNSAMAMEFVSIVLGVLLALVLSEWAADRENKQLADAALTNIHVEIDDNRRALQIIHENNLATVAALSDQSADDDRQFIPGMQLRETAWSTFLETGLSAYIEYDIVLELSQLYSIQQIYKQTGQHLIEASMTASAVAAASGTEIDNDHYAAVFLDYFQILTAIEQQLLDSYEALNLEPD